MLTRLIDLATSSPNPDPNPNPNPIPIPNPNLLADVDEAHRLGDVALVVAYVVAHGLNERLIYG